MAALCALAGGGRALAAPVLEAPGLVVRYEAPDEGRARAAAATIESIEADVERTLGARPPEPLLVHLAKNDADFERAVAELTGGRSRPPTWALAVALAEQGAVVVRASRLEALSWNDLRPTLTHELAHLALAQGTRLPRFLDEGLATYAEGRRVGRADRTVLERLARNGRLPTFEQLTASFPPHEEEASVSYLESLAFVEWLEAAGGPAAIHDFTRRVARGDPWEPAFERAFKAPLHGYEIAFRAELEKSYSVTRDIFERGSLITVAALLVVIAFVRYRRRRVAMLEALDPARPPPEAPLTIDALEDDEAHGDAPDAR